MRSIQIAKSLFLLLLAMSFALPAFAQSDVSAARGARQLRFASHRPVEHLRLQVHDADGEADDKFGAPVAISGDTMLVGASFVDVGGNTNQGSAHVFLICLGLAERQKVTTNNESAESFDPSIAISGDTAVVGSGFDYIGGNRQNI